MTDQEKNEVLAKWAEPVPLRGVAETFDMIAPTYDACFSSRYELHEDELIAGRVAPYTAGRVIDLGCGTGALLKMADMAPSNYLGLDISPGMLKRARMIYPTHQFMQVSMETIPVLSQTADNVVSIFGGFSFVDRPKAVVAEIARVLRPGGRFFIMAGGLGYVRGKTKLDGLNDVRRLWTPQWLNALFNWDFHDIVVRPFSYRTLPGIPLQVYRPLEWVLGKIAPRSASWLIITGTA